MERRFRPSGVLWASVRTGLVHLDLAKEDEPATTSLALETFLEFGLKRTKGLEGRPAHVEVRDPVVSYLPYPDSIPFDRPAHFALHSREEAAYVAKTLAHMFVATDGALEWLAAQTWRFPSGSRRAKRGR